MRRLEAGGLLAVQHRKGGNPKTGTNFYCATLPEGANELRRSKWGGAKLTTARGGPHDVRGERRSPESALKRVESPDADAAAPDGASSASRRSEPEAVWGECLNCGEEANLHESLAYSCCSEECHLECIETSEREIAAMIAEGISPAAGARNLLRDLEGKRKAS